jgi:hypothetical protein
VNTKAARPYSVSLARASASSAESNGTIGITGPKISSVRTGAPAGTSVSTVGG